MASLINTLYLALAKQGAEIFALQIQQTKIQETCVWKWILQNKRFLSTIRAFFCQNNRNNVFLVIN